MKTFRSLEFPRNRRQFKKLLAKAYGVHYIEDNDVDTLAKYLTLGHFDKLTDRESTRLINLLKCLQEQ